MSIKIKQSQVNSLNEMLTAFLRYDPEVVPDYKEDIMNIAKLAAAIEAMPGFVDVGEFDPKAQAMDRAFEEINIFWRYDMGSDIRIPVKLIYEGCRNPFMRIPMNERRQYMVKVVLTRLSVTLTLNSLKDLGNYLEQSIDELKGEREARRDNIEALEIRHAFVDVVENFHDLTVREKHYVKVLKNTLKDILSILVVGNDISDACIAWYTDCIEKYSITKRSGLYDLGGMDIPEFWYSGDEVSDLAPSDYFG